MPQQKAEFKYDQSKTVNSYLSLKMNSFISLFLLYLIKYPTLFFALNCKKLR